MTTTYTGKLFGDGLRIAIACGRFNDFITDRLLTGAMDGLTRHGVDDASITVVWAPGAFELPIVAKQLASSGEYDAVICLGAVIRGATGHYEHVAGQTAAGIQRAQLDTGVPVVFGVLTYSKVMNRPIRIVLAVPQDSPAQTVDDLPRELRVATEYPELTRRFLEKRGKQPAIVFSYGATEAKVGINIADAVVDLTE